MGIPSIGIPCHFPIPASLGHANGLTETGLSIPNFLIEMVVLVVQQAVQQQLSVFASGAAVAEAVECMLPGFVPLQCWLGPEASLPVAVTDQVVPSVVALVALVEHASFDIVVGTPAVAMVEPVLVPAAVV